MKITVVRTGGVGGMRKEAQIDTSALDSRHADEIHRLVAAADVPGLAEPTISMKGAPDRFHYTLTLEDGARTHAVTFEEERTPERVRPLLEAIRRLSEAGDAASGRETV